MGMAKNSKGKSVAQRRPAMAGGRESMYGGTQGGAAPANVAAPGETTTPTTTGATSAPKQGPFVGYRPNGVGGVGQTSGPKRASMPTAPLPPQQRF